MKRKLFFVYGVACHALFLGVYAWMAAFVGNLGFGLIPTIDAPRAGSLASAIMIDVLLIAVFGLQHSIMARPAFKRWWTQFIPQPIERSTYVMASCVLMMLLLWQWRPLGGVVWDVGDPTGRTALHALFALGWLLVPAVSLLINHFDLFGTRQVWLHLREKDYSQLPFKTPIAYRVVRHPLYVGWMIAFWATPTMTVSHLLFAALLSAYILIAIPLEERDLLAHFGRKYADYRRSVGGLLPRLRLSGAVTLDDSVFADFTWWSWLTMLALLTARLAAGWDAPILAAAGLCGGLALLDLILRRGDLRAMSVQIRLGYVLLLFVGLLRGMAWIHLMQIAGTTLRVITGYCMLERELLLLPWNLAGPLTLARVWEVVTARPVGGLLRFCGDDDAPVDAACALSFEVAPSAG